MKTTSQKQKARSALLRNGKTHLFKSLFLCFYLLMLQNLPQTSSGQPGGGLKNIVKTARPALPDRQGCRNRSGKAVSIIFVGNINYLVNIMRLVSTILPSAIRAYIYIPDVNVAPAIFTLPLPVFRALKSIN